MLGIRRTLDIFHKTKEAISIKIYNQWHLGVVSVAVPESIAEGIPLAAGGGRERQIWRLHWQGMGGSGLASSKDWQGMPLVFPMIFHGNKTYWETLKLPWVVSKYGSGKQDAPARPRCSAGSAGLCGSQPSTCPGLSRPEQGRHQTNSWVILMVMRGFMIGYGWLLFFCWGGCWVNYVGANLRFTLYIYYRLGSTLYMGLVWIFDSHTISLVGSFKLCCAVAGAFSLATRLLAYASAVIESQA